MLPKYSHFSVINHQNRSTPPLEQLGYASRTPTSTESAISQPLALPSPSEPSRSSVTASLYRHYHIQFSKHKIPREITRKRSLEKLQEMRKGLKDFSAKLCFMFNVIELASKD